MAEHGMYTPQTISTVGVTGRDRRFAFAVDEMHCVAPNASMILLCLCHPRQSTFAQFDQLKFLSLDNCQLEDGHLAVLETLGLRYLSLRNNNKLTDTGLGRTLFKVKLRSIIGLDLSGCDVGPESMRALASLAADEDVLSDEFLLENRLIKLYVCESLTLFEFAQRMDKVLAKCPRLVGLRALWIRSRQALPIERAPVLYPTRKHWDSSPLAFLRGCTSLWSLDLSDSELTLQDWLDVCQVPSLKALTLTNCHLDQDFFITENVYGEKCFRQVAFAPGLRFLDLRNNKVASEVVYGHLVDRLPPHTLVLIPSHDEDREFVNGQRLEPEALKPEYAWRMFYGNKT